VVAAFAWQPRTFLWGWLSAMKPKLRIWSIFHLLTSMTLLCSFASVASAEWHEKVLYSFEGGSDGAVPAGGVVFDKAGNLYGATEDGGASNCDGPGQCGTVYQLKPPVQEGGAWTETVLYVFKGHAQNDGATPEGGLVIDGAGNLYGTTGYGGTGPCTLLGGAVGCGTVYELSPPARQGDPWKEKILYSFQGGNDGFVASGDLGFDKAGNLYGATLFGGGKGTTCDSLYGGQCGVVFELSPPKTKGGKWTENVLHRFAGIESGKQNGDGASPNGGLVLDSKGTIYGTTYIGGYNCPHNSNQGCGTVFNLKPPTKKGEAWVETVVHRFEASGDDDGGGPAAPVTFGRNGDLYTTTVGGGGGNFPSGTVVQLVPLSSGRWKEKVLHSFQDNGDGSEPRSGLTFDSKGNLYGTATGGGGSNFAGTVFRLKKNPAGGWAFATVYSFKGVNNGDGAYPSGDIVFNAGNIFGTTEVGGAGSSCQGGCGTVFEVRP
jgi:hypothetical protein